MPDTGYSRKEEMAVKKKIKFSDVAINLILGFCGLVCLIPILNTVAISFSDRTSAALGLVRLWPVNFTLASYQNMLEETQFWTSFLVSVKRVVIGVSLNMLLSILMAYPLSKSESVFYKKKYYMWIVVFTMMFNGGLVPTFMVVSKLHMMDTFWALVLPGAVPVFNVIILMNFFKAIPQSLRNLLMWMVQAPGRFCLRFTFRSPKHPWQRLDYLQWLPTGTPISMEKFISIP